MSQWYLRTQDEVFGPESQERLVEWARLGRIQPGQEISDDNMIWRRVEDIPFLDMRFSIDLGDGNPRGPFNRAAAEALLASGRLPPTAALVETREPFEEEPMEEPKEEPAEELPEERPVEQPPEKAVEKIDTRVAELTRQVEERQARAKDLEQRLDAAEARAKDLQAKLEERDAHVRELAERIDSAEARARELSEKADRAAAHVKELDEMLAAATRVAGENEKACNDEKAASEKLREQVSALEDELRRLPQTASEIADIQAAVYSIMTGEAEELSAIAEAEKKEFDEFRRRHQERIDRLMDRRRTLLKRAGTNIEDMTRRALVSRPEDPRTARIAKEYEDFRRLAEKRAAESERQIRELTERLRLSQAETARAAAGAKDLTQLRAEIEGLRAQLQQREKELLSEKQTNEGLRQQQATKQQMLMARLATLESPSIGTAQSLSTNQSREAHLVKLPSWMRIGK